MSTSLFLVRPPSLHGESLSSWRQRSAWRNGYRLFPLPDERGRRSDPDIGLYESELKWVADGHNVSVDDVIGLTLRGQVGKIIEELELRSQPRWWLRARYGHKQRPYGPMFCPQCLAHDTVPYFRLAWRFAFLTECVEHHCQLVDQCPECKRPPWPGGVGLKSRISCNFDRMNLCWYCQHDLSTLVPIISENHSSSILMEGLRSGKLNLGGCSIPVLEALHALRGICQIFLRTRARKAISASLGKWSVLAGKLSNESQHTFSVDHLRVNDRLLLVPAALNVLSGWPNSFLEFADQSGLSRTHFNDSDGLQPTWMNEVIFDRLAIQNRKVTESIIEQTVSTWRHKHGTLPTKKKLREVLQWQGKKGLERFYSKRDRATKEETKVFADAACYAMRTPPIGKRSHRHLLMDLAVLSFCIFHNCPIEAGSVLTFKQVIFEIESINDQMSVDESMRPMIDELLLGMKGISVGISETMEKSHAYPRQLKKRLVCLMTNMDIMLRRDVSVFSG